VLGDHGVRLGLEYVGPKTSWSASRFPFIHTMAEMKDLIAEINRDNVGFLLDSWHWYTARETEADLLTLKAADVVLCHLNDAPAGVPVDQQIDNRRALPCATGVIDVKAFSRRHDPDRLRRPGRVRALHPELRSLAPEQVLENRRHGHEEGRGAGGSALKSEFRIPNSERSLKSEFRNRKNIGTVPDL